jgi:hypothetical protein
LNEGNSLPKPDGSGNYWGLVVIKIPDAAAFGTSYTRTLDSTGLGTEISISFTFKVADCASLIAQSAPVDLATITDFKIYS